MRRPRVPDRHGALTSPRARADGDASPSTRDVSGYTGPLPPRDQLRGQWGTYGQRCVICRGKVLFDWVLRAPSCKVAHASCYEAVRLDRALAERRRDES